jgi:hypothetical protein
LKAALGNPALCFQFLAPFFLLDDNVCEKAGIAKNGKIELQ